MLLRWFLLAATLTANGAPGRSDDPSTAAERAVPAQGLPFAPGEQIDLDVEYLHVRTGRARLIVGRPEGVVWPVICQARTDAIGTLVDIREHYVSYWDVAAGVTRWSDLSALEVGDRHTDRSRFDREIGRATVQVIRKGTWTETTHDVPRDVHDLTSALLHLRMAPLVQGEHLELPVFVGRTMFTLRADVEGKEMIDTPAGRFDTVRIRLQLGLKDKFKTSRDAHLWLSSDRRHIPVRASVDFAIGSVTATLAGYRAGTPATAGPSP